MNPKDLLDKVVEFGTVSPYRSGIPALFGGVYIGLALPLTAQNQFDQSQLQTDPHTIR